jgi:hypothetical protein
LEQVLMLYNPWSWALLKSHLHSISHGPDFDKAQGLSGFTLHKISIVWGCWWKHIFFHLSWIKNSKWRVPTPYLNPKGVLI